MAVIGGCVGKVLLGGWRVGFLEAKTNDRTIRKTEHEVQCP